MDSLQSIIATANKHGRDFCTQGLVTHRAAGGTVRLRADQRGYLQFEVWQEGLPTTLRATIGEWRSWLDGQMFGEWAVMPNAKIKERLFFERAKKLLGELEAVKCT